MSYIGNEPIVSATRTITEITATAGQTVFNANGGYTVGYIDVFLNGAQLQTVDFTATNGSSITLTEAAQVGDVLKLVAWGTFSTSNLVSPNYTGTLTGGTGVVNIGSGQLYKDASGNVGIGTSSPQAPLNVSHSVTSRSDTLRLTNADTGGYGPWLNFYGNYSSGYSFAKIGTENDNGTGGSLRFHTADTSKVSQERMRIDSSGNLLVGTTTSLYSTRLTAAGTSAGGPAAEFRVSANNLPEPTTYFIKNDNNTTTSNVFCRFVIANGGGASGQINANGASSAAFGTWSDQRLKTNIENLPTQLSNICSLRPVEFDYIQSEGGGHQIGFIAQEMQEVYPDAVGERSDGMLTLTGWDKTTARLVKAIQEQQAIITDLKSRIETLESK